MSNLASSQEDHPTVAIANLGCRANQYDGNYLGALLKNNGYRLIDFKESADIYVINTCTVTDGADRDGRNLIRRTKRRNPESITVVTGCYAQTQPKEVAEVVGVDLVLGNNQKAGLLGHLEEARTRHQNQNTAAKIVVEDIFKQRELEVFGHAQHSAQTRAYVKIQDGCNQFCSFCMIPFARGRNRSVAIPKILDELKRLSAAGFYEAVLTGIHIGTYGHDLDGQTNLATLLRAIVKERPIHRVRISSIDPEEVSDELLEVWSSEKIFCPHLHIPLQSGDDATLKLMRRRYTRGEFFELTQKLQKRFPRLGLGTDVMVGFPYEDEARFQNTYDLLQDSAVNYFHVFPYSAKRGTQAAKMLGQVAPAAKKARVAALRELSDRKAKAWRSSFLGKRVEVLLEKRRDPCQSDAHTGMQGCFEEWTGVSEHYLPVSVMSSKADSGQLIECVLQQEKGGRLAGTH